MLHANDDGIIITSVALLVLPGCCKWRMFVCMIIVGKWPNRICRTCAIWRVGWSVANACHCLCEFQRHYSLINDKLDSYHSNSMCCITTICIQKSVLSLFFVVRVLLAALSVALCWTGWPILMVQWHSQQAKRACLLGDKSRRCDSRSKELVKKIVFFLFIFAS